MRKWIYTAGAERIGHLALVRRSPASRAFARRQLLLLALAAAVFQLTYAGWHRVLRTADNETLLVTTPGGRAWLLVTEAPASATNLGLVALWCNPARGGIVLLIAFATGTLFATLAMAVLHLGSEATLGHAHRGADRLRGAIHYSTAWTQPILYAALIILALPLRDILGIIEPRIAPPRTAMTATAAVMAGSSCLMWWFWLIRMSLSLPIGPRNRAAVFHAVGAPVIIAGLVVAWMAGLQRLFDFLWPLLKLTW